MGRFLIDLVKINRLSLFRDNNKIIHLFSYLLAVLLVMCFVNCSNHQISKMEETWHEFRALHPYSYQTVALKHYGDTCVFVMSEPDSWVKEADLKQLFDKYDGELIIRYQPYGFDGQLTDAVGCAIFDSSSFHIFEKELFTLLYKTDYKPYYTDLDSPTKHVYFSENYNLNYSISPFIFELDLNERFLSPFSNGDSEEKTISELLDSDMLCSNKIYFSKERGFVVWIIDTDSTIQVETFLTNARRFTLDTDLILGSIPRRENSNKVAIVAREREVPVTILPPLRCETLLQLASNSNDELKLTFDSYNKSINDSTLATSISMTNWLENTELGNLMVMTDVLLKSWSENGIVRDSFMDYPFPEKYPFEKGVSYELGYIPNYLWNFLFDGETGCLPINYNPPLDNLETGREQEISYKARLHFAKMNCLDIVRVAQYAAVYYSLNGIKLYYPKQNDSWVKTPTWTISNKPWGIGGYASLAKVPLRLKTPRVPTNYLSPRLPYIPHTPYTGIINPIYINHSLHPSSIDPQMVNLIVRHPELGNVLEKEPELGDIIIKHPRLANVVLKYPILVNVLIEYPQLAVVLEKHIKLAEIVSIYPKFAYMLPSSEYPNLAKVLDNNPDLAEELEKYPDLADFINKNPQMAKILKEHPDLCKTLIEYEGLADILINKQELVEVVSLYPFLADVLTRTPKFADALGKNPIMAEELAKIPNLAELLALNPNLIELLSRNIRISLRESMNISKSTNVQRGFDISIHNSTSSQENVLSKSQVQEILDIANKKTNRIIEMRLQIKKIGIHVKDVKWEINNTLRAFIIIDRYEEGLKQAA